VQFGTAIGTCFRKGLTFSGRASRPEYWYFVLFIILGMMVSARIDVALFGPFVPARFAGAFTLIALVPLLAASWRRMQDTGRSGLHVLYPLIVFVGVSSYIGFVSDAGLMTSDLGTTIGEIGGLIAAAGLLFLMVTPFLVIWWLTRPSQPGPNKWGLPPNRAASAPANGQPWS